MNWKRHLTTFLIVAAVGLLFLVPRSACTPGGGRSAGPPPEARVVELHLQDPPLAEGRLAAYSFAVRAEVADTRQKRQQGLAGRAGLQPGSGMLYVYAEPQQPEFCAAATPFAVSMAFIRADGTVSEVRRCMPNDPEVFRPQEPILYALEVRAGWFEDRNVGPGARFVPANGAEWPTAQPEPQPEQPAPPEAAAQPS